MSKLPAYLAVIFGLVAAVLWFGFVRPVARQSGIGTIRSKTFKPAGTYARYDAGANRGMRMPTEIPIAESYIFEITLQGRDEPVAVALNTALSESFSVNQPVRVEYEQRGFGPWWSHLYVVRVEPLNAPAPH